MDISRKRSRDEMEDDHDDDDNENRRSFIDSGQIMAISQPSMVVTATRCPVVNIADDGIIEKILLVDFMCHARLEVSLNPSVNIIFGQNGSGKSAIMVAIIVALGGKATSTQRASSLTSFIRTGCSQAEIHLTLRNGSSEAYKPLEYGNSITIACTIKRDGGTSYKIKSHSNHIIASSKEELLRIVNQFNIQVDNPVCMMSQDTGHHFLHGTSPSEKYKLFIQATHLGQKAEDHDQAREHHEFMRKEIQLKKRMLPNLQNKLKDCEDQVQDIEQLKTLELKEKELSSEFMWAVAIELENEMKNLEHKIAQEQSKLKDLDFKIAKYEYKCSNKKNDAAEAKIELLDITYETKVIESQTNELDNTKRTLDRELTEMKREYDIVIGNMKSIQDEKKQFEKKVEETFNMKLANQHEALKCEHELMMNNVKLIEEKLEIARRDYQSKDNDKRLVDEASHQTKSSIDNLNQQISDFLSKLSQSDNKLHGFPNWMSELIQTLKYNQRQFSLSPLGPIGLYIKVNQQKWCSAIEISIGYNNLCAFVVNNHEDEVKFKRIAKDIISKYPRASSPTCFISTFTGQQCNISRNVPQCHHVCLIDMITVANPDIMNVLIDMFNIDSTILIENKDGARQVMANPPVNTKNCYTIDGDRVLPNRRYYSNKIRRPFGILHVNEEESIRQQQGEWLERFQMEVCQHQQELEDQQSKIRVLEMEQCDIQQYIYRSTIKLKELHAKIDKTRVKIDKIDDKNQDEDIATWINELDMKLKDWEDKLKATRAAIEKKKDELAKHYDKVNSHIQMSRAISSRVDEAKVKLKSVSEDLQIFERSLSDYKEQKRQMQQIVEEGLKRHETARGNYNRALDMAEMHCPRIDTSRRSASIQVEIDNIKKALTKYSHIRENQELARENYVKAMEHFIATNEAIEKDTESLKKLEESLHMNISSYGELHVRIATRATLFFSEFVRRRGYEGTLKFNVKEQKLDIIINVNKQKTTKNTCCLSRGERSFVTVSFIMALWEAMDCPFRCLDNLDVFMDLFNRKISMQLMIEEAESLPGKQFIIFTSQDMSSLEIKNYGKCKVLKLNAPDHSQRTLD